MLHEIQPGDVVIVTVVEPSKNYPIKPSEIMPCLKAGIDGTASSIVLVVGGTETSVHVIRAKKAEDKPKPDIVCTRCGTPATISNFCMCGKPGCIGCIGCCKKSQSGEPDAKPKPDWPAWRDINEQPPPLDSERPILAWNCAFGGRVEYVLAAITTDTTRYTHWMPLPTAPTRDAEVTHDRPA